MKDSDSMTIEAVGELEDRLMEIQDRIGEIQSRLDEITAKLGELRAEGAPEQGEALREERVQLAAELEELQNAVPILRERIDRGFKEALTEEAEARLLGIKKAHGSLASELGEDVERIVRTAQAFAEAAERANVRYRQLLGLEVEAQALAVRFGLTAPDLRQVTAPGRVDEALAALKLAQSARLDLPNTIAKVRKGGPPKDSPGARLIRQAGPTEAEVREEERVEREQQRREREEAALMTDPSVERELARAQAWPKNVPLT